MMNKRCLGFGVLFLLVLSIVGSVSALAISSPYSNTPYIPLKVAPGETKDFVLVIKSNIDMVVRAEVSKGSEVVQITDAVKIYTVPAGGEPEVHVRVTIPADMPLQSTPEVKLLFTQVSESNASGPVSIANAVEYNLPMVVELAPVTPEAAAPGTNWSLWIVIGVVVLIILIVLLKGKKKK